MLPIWANCSDNRRDGEDMRCGIPIFWPMQKTPPHFVFSLAVLLACLSASAFSQTIPERFDRIGQKPRTIHFTNPLPLDESGGHLQGIQSLGPDGDAFVLSGSSDSYAYCLRVADHEVKQVMEMDQKPFKHAGGFQLADGYLAVGIEDNLAKDKSKVFVYQIQGDEIQATPTWVIGREGDAMRSTAGCVGLAGQQDELLVVVGDWDTRHLDFYQIHARQGSGSPEAPFVSIAAAGLARDSWINPDWHSYQNINLLQDNNGALYLVGLGTDGENQNVADLFELSLKNEGSELRKVRSRQFQSDPEVSFRAGAGIHQSGDGRLWVVACSSHIGSKGVIQVWE